MPGHEASPEPCRMGLGWASPSPPALAVFLRGQGKEEISLLMGALVHPSKGPEPLSCAQAGHQGTIIRRVADVCGALAVCQVPRRAQLTFYLVQSPQRSHEVVALVPVLETRTVRHRKMKPHS